MKSKFEIEITMTAKISRDVALQMIVSAVEKEAGKQVKNIEIDYQDNEFKGFKVSFDHGIPVDKTNYIPSKEFIIETFGAED